MTGLQVFKNSLFEVAAKVEGDTVLFDAEKVAKCLGFTQIKNDKEYVRWETINKYLNSNVSQNVGKGSLIPEPMVYKLAFKASNEVAERFQDWLAIEVLPQIRKNGFYSSFDGKKETFELQLLGAEFASRMLRVDESSKVRMLEEVHKAHGVPTNHLPAYVNEELKVSLTQLLKEHDVKMSAAKANARLIELGLLEIKKRKSSKSDGMKEFKSLTAKGQYYGANAVSPRNSNETQPLYYPSKFGELLQLI